MLSRAELRKSDQSVYQYFRHRCAHSYSWSYREDTAHARIFQAYCSAVEKNLTFIYIFIPLCLLTENEWTTVFINNLFQTITLQITNLNLTIVGLKVFGKMHYWKQITVWLLFSVALSTSILWPVVFPIKRTERKETGKLCPTVSQRTGGFYHLRWWNHWKHWNCGH